MIVRVTLCTTILLSSLFSCRSNSSEIAGCPFEVNTSKNIDCGYFSVPENRSDPQSREINLAYVTIKTDAVDKREPVVYLMGGPGGSAISLIQFFQFHPITKSHDLILVDQRGTGFSGGLCPEMGDQIIDLVAQDITSEEEFAILSSKVKECKDRLESKNIDPSYYHTLENAKDIIALRKHLKIRKWSLYGGSYGTRLALEIAELDQSGITSMILAGPISREINFYQDYAQNFSHALNKVFEACLADEGCNTNFPGLDNVYLSLLDKFQEEPFNVTVNGLKYSLNGSDISLITHQLLYNRSTISIIPSYIYALKNGNKSMVESAMLPLISVSGNVDFGMYMSAQAYDEADQNISKSFEVGKKEVDIMKYGTSFHNSEVQITPKWNSKRFVTTSKRYQHSIPTLILAGEYDPVTPPSNGEYVHSQLRTSYFFVIKGRGHTLYDNCSNSIIANFLKYPTREPSSACIELLPEVTFK